MGMGGMGGLQLGVTLEELYVGTVKRVELPSQGGRRGMQIDPKPTPTPTPIPKLCPNPNPNPNPNPDQARHAD